MSMIRALDDCRSARYKHLWSQHSIIVDWRVTNVYDHNTQWFISARYKRLWSQHSMIVYRRVTNVYDHNTQWLYIGALQTSLIRTLDDCRSACYKRLWSEHSIIVDNGTIAIFHCSVSSFHRALGLRMTLLIYNTFWGLSTQLSLHATCLPVLHTWT